MGCPPNLIAPHIPHLGESAEFEGGGIAARRAAVELISDLQDGGENWHKVRAVAQSCAEEHGAK